MSKDPRRGVVLGTSGHARVCIELLDSDPSVQLVGCVGPERPNISGFPLSYLGPDAVLASLRDDGITHAFVAIGDNRLRSTCQGVVRSLGFHLLNAIGAGAVISPLARLADGVAVMNGAVVNPGVVLEEGVVVNTNASVDHDCVLRAFSHVAPGCSIAGSVTIDRGAFIGVGACIVPRAHVGEWSTIGAGAAVISDIPPRSTAVGVPARVRAAVPEPMP